MVQSIDVIVIFDKMMKEPKPVRFKIYDCGHWKSVNVDRIYNTEWMRLEGKVQIVYSCASRSCNGQMINYNSTRVSMVIPVITDAADGTNKVPAASKN